MRIVLDLTKNQTIYEVGIVPIDLLKYLLKLYAASFQFQPLNEIVDKLESTIDSCNTLKELENVVKRWIAERTLIDQLTSNNVESFYETDIDFIYK
jgi:hypothetical protein